MLKNFIILTSLLLISCADNIAKHGIEVKQEDLAKLNIGASRKLVVEEIIGLPTVKTKRGDKDIWLYFDYQRNKKALKKAYYYKYMAYEFEFTVNKLTNIKEYNLNDMNMVQIEPHITESVTKKESIFKQFLRNIGRFDSNNDL